MLNIVLFGPPGAGKGTQSEKLIVHYQLIHLSTGDILRAEIAAGTELGKNAKDIMDKGLLVPDDVVIGMIENKIKSNPDAKGFIFDGFPRTVAQAEALDKMCSANGIEVHCMLALVVEDEELYKRILERGKTSGRSDDQNPELIKQRIEEYNKKTKPVADYYASQNKYYAINGMADINTVFQEITSVLSNLQKR
ncbi:MAG: adenylate kinase [Cytophagaceae bacterium]|nr:adenylate kinase [Cytophagaceae bacterium]MDW8455532.1 adenylate kinase [Cytophagaceae bacterium]